MELSEAQRIKLHKFLSDFEYSVQHGINPVGGCYDSRLVYCKNQHRLTTEEFDFIVTTISDHNGSIFGARLHVEMAAGRKPFCPIPPPRSIALSHGGNNENIHLQARW